MFWWTERLYWIWHMYFSQCVPIVFWIILFCDIFHLLFRKQWRFSESESGCTTRVDILGLENYLHSICCLHFICYQLLYTCFYTCVFIYFSNLYKYMVMLSNCWYLKYCALCYINTGCGRYIFVVGRGGFIMLKLNWLRSFVLIRKDRNLIVNK